MAAVAGIFLLAGATALAALGILDHQGKKRLAQKQEAVPESMNFSASLDGSEIPGTGQLRYQGKTYTYQNDRMTFLIMGIDKTGKMESSEDLYADRRTPSSWRFWIRKSAASASSASTGTP